MSYLAEAGRGVHRVEDDVQAAWDGELWMEPVRASLWCFQAMTNADM